MLEVADSASLPVRGGALASPEMPLIVDSLIAIELPVAVMPGRPVAVQRCTVTSEQPVIVSVGSVLTGNVEASKPLSPSPWNRSAPAQELAAIRNGEPRPFAPRLTNAACRPAA